MSKYALPLLVLLSGCAAPAIVGPAPDGDLRSATWVLRRLDGNRVKCTDPEAATLRLVAGHIVDGTSACNDVGGEELRWSADASGKTGVFDRDRTRATITTAVGCANAAALQLGNRFWAQMVNARGWSTTATTLTIKFSDGSSAHLRRVSRTGR